MRTRIDGKFGIVIVAALAGLLAVGVFLTGTVVAQGLMRGWHPGGWHGGMMGGWGNASPRDPSVPRLSLSQVDGKVADYLALYYGKADLRVAEVMEFENNFYAQVQERSTGINAFELLIDPYAGNVWPEYGPNMMWNTKYGMMGPMGMMRGLIWGGRTQATADMPIEPERAVQLAQRFLDSKHLGWTAEEEPDTFYGYYTIHSLDKDGTVQGMLSVNGYSGRVWYHTWHGQFVGMEESEG